MVQFAFGLLTDLWFSVSAVWFKSVNWCQQLRNMICSFQGMLFLISLSMKHSVILMTFFEVMVTS